MAILIIGGATDCAELIESLREDISTDIYEDEGYLVNLNEYAGLVYNERDFELMRNRNKSWQSMNKGRFSKKQRRKQC